MSINQFSARILSAATIGSLLVFSFAINIPFAHATTDSFTTSGTWTAPAGVTSVDVEAWGGGGGGGNSSTRVGGGGGAYSKKLSITVVPGNSYTVTVGAGGGVSVAGGDSWFSTSATVLAKGGAAHGNGGAATSGIGDTKFSGGNGCNGGGFGAGGAGGGGAGDSANGGNGTCPGTSSTGGAGGVNFGGAGGNGGNSAGTVGGTLGGGGGSASGFGGGGAAGARGEVRITYTAATGPAKPTLTLRDNTTFIVRDTTVTIKN
jgi:hypothetical protein